MKKILNKLEFIILFIITLLLFSYLFSNYNILGADTKFHYSNIQALYIKITNLDFYFKLLPLVGEGFFYGTPIFYANMPHLVTAIIGCILRIMNIDNFLVISMKICYIAVFYFSSIIMYQWIKSVSNNRYISLVGATFYLTLPFKLWDAYIRDGYTEVFTFLFVPMIFYGLHLLLEKNDVKKFYIFFIIGASGVTLSHLITTFYTLIASIIYLALYYKEVLKKEKLKKIIIGVLITLGITAYYWMPFIEHYLYGDYRIFVDTGLDLKEMFINSIITWQEYLIPSSKAGTHNFFIPITLLICFIIICLLCIIKRKLKIDLSKSVTVACIITIVFVIISTNKTLWLYLPEKLYSFQYAFRMLIIPFCFMCFSAPFTLICIKKIKIQKIISFICIILTIIISYITIDNAYTSTYNFKNNNPSINGMGWQQEYLPTKAYIWYQENGLKLSERKDGLVILKGNPEINNEFKRSIYYEFTIKNDNETYIIEFPYYYYLGYKAYIVNNGNKIKLDTFSSERGLVSIESNKSGKLVLEYKGTYVTITSYIISFVSIILFLVLLKYKKV